MCVIHYWWVYFPYYEQKPIEHLRLLKDFQVWPERDTPCLYDYITPRP